MGNLFTIDQMGVLLLLYLISNSFPANSQSEKVYQLLKTQEGFSPSMFRILKGPSADSVLENIFKLAIEAEDLPMVKDLIKAGADVNVNNCTLGYWAIPWTPLQFACLKGNALLAQELITAGSDVDTPQSEWKFSTILLAIYGYERFIRRKSWQRPLVPKPVDNESLIHLVQVLLDGGASVNAVKLGMNHTLKLGDPMYEIIASQHSPLTLASKFRYDELVHFLIMKGADVRFRMNGESSALRLSLCIINIVEGDMETLADDFQHWDRFVSEPEVRTIILSISHRLMRAGVDLNDHVPCNFAPSGEHLGLECYSVLDLAVLIKSTELIDLMLHAGAKTTHHSLDLAIQVENFDMFSKLLEEGAAIPDWASSETQGETSPFFRNEDPRNTKDVYLQRMRALVIAAIRLGATSKLDCLIRSMNGSTMNILDGCAGLTTAIEHCCRNGHMETLQYLLESDIMPKSPPAATFGLSVLFSIRHDLKVVLDLFVEKGADVNAGEYSSGRIEIPLLLAIEKGDVELVRKLIKSGATLDDKQSCPNSCNDHEGPGNMLVAAIEASNLAVTEEILGECVDINGTGECSSLTERCGCCTPITMAIMKRNWTLVDRLRCDGANLNSTGQNLGVVRCHTPLWASAYQKHFKLAKSFIDAGAEVNDRMAFEAAVNNRDVNKQFKQVASRELTGLPS